VSDLSGLVEGHVYRVRYDCRDIGYGGESGERDYVYRGETGGAGKHTFAPVVSGDEIYLFPDEVTEISEDQGTEAEVTVKYAAWKPETIALADRGDIGIDIQASRTWSLRFLNDKIPGAIIEVDVYATAYYDDIGADDPSETFGVQVLTAYRVTAGGGSQDRRDDGWSEHTYEWLPGKPVTVEDAVMMAEQVAKWYADGSLRPPRWDGQIWTHHDDRPQR
jgi:hypothetical protein